MPYVAFEHTHYYFGMLYIISFCVKSILFLMNSPSFEKVNKVVKIPEMIIATLFVSAGIYMFFNRGGFGQPNVLWFLFKFLFVIASMPLGIIGFKRGNKAIVTLLIVGFVAIFAYSYMLYH